MEEVSLSYADYLKGKRVCIIGPSESLMEKKRAKLIDFYDVVVRINSGYPIPEHLYPYTGKRCDVVYQHGNTGPAKSKERIAEAKAGGVKWVVCVHPEGKPSSTRVKKICQGVVNFRAVPKELRASFQAEVNTSPNAGQVAIRDLLSFDITELYITGMDFYMSKYYNGYSSKRLTIGGHDQYKQFQSFIKLYEADKRIKLDETLQGIVKIRDLFQDAIKQNVKGKALEICRPKMELHKSNHDVVYENLRSTMRKRFDQTDWNQYDAVVVHDTGWAHLYHKYLKAAKEINPKLKIIVEMKSDRERRFVQRLDDRLSTEHVLKLNVAII
jgi:hypothetical protein